MVKIFVHTKSSGSDWKNNFHNFSRAPYVGEFIVLSQESKWHEVKTVSHLPFDGSDWEVEVWATQIDDSVKAEKINPKL